MKQINKYIVERLHINKDIGKHIEYNYHPTSRNELKQLVNKLINERGYNADLNDIDTSEITDMNFMFYESPFNGDISNWDVSNVKDMMCMFYFSEFTAKNEDISNWDVRNVQNMYLMFNGTPLAKNTPKWYK